MFHSATARRRLFFTLDRMRGGEISAHLADLANSAANPANAGKKSRQQLKEFLSHSTETTSFYREYKNAQDLSEFPVVPKQLIKERYDDFLSSAYNRKSLLPRRTSGSYGTPFTFWVTPSKRARQLAEIIHFSHRAGFEIGMRHAYTLVEKKPWWKRFMQNEITLDPTYLSPERLESHRKEILRQRIEFLIGYPSVIAPIAETCAAHGDNPASFCLQGVICIAEPLHEDVRARIKEVFGCDVLSRYATLELGVLAQQLRGERSFVANTATFHIEVLALNRDAPAPHGELGRIVVTDLYSHAMPLIRYDTGDLGVASSANGVLTLARVEGRQVEAVFSTAGVRVSPMSIINETEGNIAGVVQYQFIQKSAKQYLLRLVTLPEFPGPGTIEKRLQSILGEDAEILFEFPSSIPPLPSGKRPYIMSQWAPSPASQQFTPQPDVGR